jgi:hypothetical protein
MTFAVMPCGDNRKVVRTTLTIDLLADCDCKELSDMVDVIKIPSAKIEEYNIYRSSIFTYLIDISEEGKTK